MPDTSIPERIGSYAISREIGRGGMGVVYLGHDATLDRPVAIKAITEDLADDPERLARFEREARVLASLSHGNIATVYGFETVGDRRYLVMEFVEGATLADRLADGPLTIPEALTTCAQIAAGVEAAHEAGVVHRDLKPGNVIIRPDGTPKVLDFGLARELPAQSSRSSLAGAATATVRPASHVTQEGVAIGTPGYMSPEQVRGMMVDRRTDNFAFGCILYECLVGAQVFGGMTATDSIASILQGEPDWKALPAGTPPTVQLLLRRCLHKDRRRRLRDIGDARIELEQAIDDPTSTSLGLAGAALAAAGHGPRTWRDALPWLLAVIGLAAAPVVWWRTRPVPVTPPPVMRLGVPLPANLELDFFGFPNISPDGTRLVFTCREGPGSSVIYLRAIDQPEPVPVEGTAGAETPFFSPDGEWIAFGQDGKLRKVSVRGGPPTTLCPAPHLRGGSWGTDGTITVALDRRGGLARLLAAGGTPETITETGAEGVASHRHPYCLPDGRGVIYTYTASADGGAWEASAIYLLPFDASEPRRLFTNGSHGQYVATGHVVFVRSGTLMAAPFDLDRLELTGPAVPVLDNLPSMNPGAPAGFAIAASGTLLRLTGSADVERRLVLVGADGVEEAVGAHVGDFGRPRLSPDGRFIAVTVDENQNTDIRILERERDILRPLTFHDADDGTPIWSPDGQWIVFNSRRDGEVGNLYRVRADFTGEPERLTTSPQGQWPSDWSPDGRSIIFGQMDPESVSDLWRLRFDEGGAVVGEPEPFVGRPNWQWGGRFSPDGRWVLYSSAETGRPEVYLRPAEGPGAAVQVSTEGGRQGVWSPTDDRIFYMTAPSRPSTVFAAAWSVEDEGVRVAAPERLFEIGGSGTSLRGFDVTADGARFLVTAPTEDDDVRREPTVVVNWFEELKAKTRNLSIGR